MNQGNGPKITRARLPPPLSAADCVHASKAQRSAKVEAGINVGSTPLTSVSRIGPIPPTACSRLRLA